MKHFNFKTKTYKTYQENFKYNNLSHNILTKNKIIYLRKLYKNGNNALELVLEKTHLLYKKHYELFAYDVVLTNLCSVGESVCDLVSCIVNNNIKKSLYIYKKIKQETKNYIFFLHTLYNETNKINKIVKNNEKLTFDFSMLDMYIKTEKFEDFWMNILETINLTIFKKNSITNNKTYDRFDIKPFI